MSKLISGEGLFCDFYIPDEETYKRLTDFHNYRFSENAYIYSAPHKVYTSAVYFNFDEKCKFARDLESKYTEIIETSTPRIYSNDKKFYVWRNSESTYLSLLLKKFRDISVTIRLSHFDLVPEDFSSYCNDKKVAYLLQRQHYSILTIKEVYRYIQVNHLGSIYPYRSDLLYCTMSYKQRNFLFKKLVEFGCLEKDIYVDPDDLSPDIHLDELSNSAKFHEFLCETPSGRGPRKEILWKRQTGMFAYLMEQLFKLNYIRNNKWQTVVHEHRLFISKIGNLLTFSNLSSSLYACKRTKKPSKFMREVDKIILHLRLYEGGGKR